MHLSVEGCLCACRGELSSSLLLRSAHEHLLELCPACRREWEAAGRAGGADDLFPSPVPRRSGALRPLPRERWRWRPSDLTARVELLGRLREERRRARADLARLLPLTAEDRQRAFRNARTRLASPALAEMLLTASRERVRADPEDSADLAGLVHAVIARMPRSRQEAPWARNLDVRAIAHRANALRIAGDLVAADQGFAAVREKLASGPLDDLAIEAEIASLEVSLRFDQRNLLSAETLLDRVQELLERVGDASGRVRAQVHRASVVYESGRPLEALRLLEEAVVHLDPVRDRYLFVSTVTARVIWYCNLGNWEKAQTLLGTHRRLYDATDDRHAEAVLANLDGRIALCRERYDEAAEAFIASRDLCLVLGRTYDAALSALDLACTYLEGGRTDELRRLAAGLVPSFRARGVAREALAALRLLARAVAADELTRDLLDRLRRRLEDASRGAGAAAVSALDPA